jgi:hypothetical protein
MSDSTVAPGSKVLNSAFFALRRLGGQLRRPGSTARPLSVEQEAKGVGTGEPAKLRLVDSW